MEEFQLEQMEQETEAMLRIRYLKDGDAVFEKVGNGFLSLCLGEEYYPRVNVVRMFPFSDSQKFISIRNAEEKQEEIGIIEDLDTMSPKKKEMLLEQLSLRYFTPVILKVRNIKDEYGYSYWDVVTDRGECKFTVKMGGKSISHLSEERVLIMDIDENRFEIPDVSKMTPAERKKLDLFL
ncbi:MAG: DUF1854 domain-containing protein [Lachnospiraceae bacterium]|nr:DUF1854 domain-containing protein [Lachnospiraceae bacterium]